MVTDARSEDPIYLEGLERLEEIIQRAGDASIPEPEAATLATADAQGRPSARVVLVRLRDVRGLAFFTSLRSIKSQQLRENPFAALSFWWRRLGLQVQVEGGVEPVSAEEADHYWATRPREHQLGGWSSEQSQPLESRESVENRYLEVERQFEGKDVPRPEFWLGWRVVPTMIEIWQWQPSRLHDRVRYAGTAEGWRKQRLYP